MTGIDEVERARLENAITRLENQLLFRGESLGAVASALVRALHESKQRVAVLDRQGFQRTAEEKTSDERLRSYAIMVERESALNRAEKEQYGSFLGHEFFTKSMLGQLDQFYTHTWDKLSEEGKAEMSQRVWEGVRRGEYEFIELPESVKEKEAKQMHSFLTREGTRDRFASAVPIDDKREFLEAYNAGNRQASYSVLNRPGFASAFVDRAQAELASQDVTDGKSSLRGAIKAGMEMPQFPASNEALKGSSLADLTLDDGVLETLKTAQEGPAKSAINLESSGQQRRR